MMFKRVVLSRPACLKTSEMDLGDKVLMLTFLTLAVYAKKSPLFLLAACMQHIAH
jgi:hypothetical protein